MKYHRVLGAALALILIWSSPGYGQQTAEDLFQAGLHQEEVRGDLERAIQFYRQLVEEHGASRAIAARALLHLGQCYEKLGREEAVQTYQRLLEEYADQSEMAAEARARLRELGALAAGVSEEGEESGIVFRQIKFEGLEASPFAKLSPDGGKMVYVHFQEVGSRHSLRVRNLASSGEVVLVDSVSTVWVYVEWSSPVEGTRVFPLDWTPEGGRT